VQSAFLEDAAKVYQQREEELGTEQMRKIERLVLLSVIDNRWREHLYEMDYLQEGIGLRAMAQKDPLVEYQREGFDMFLGMQESIKEDFARYVFHVEVVREDEQRRSEPTRVREERRQIPMASMSPAPPPSDTGNGRAAGGAADEAQPVAIEQAVSDKIPRNAPCPCGSGKKYKQCHGRPGVADLA
jgi:preprotein translocase subunit SecA